MKKIISIVLLLTLCLGLFAGCQQPEEPVSDLANAKAILFSKYKPASKDEIPAKSADFEVVTSVLVDGVSLEFDLKGGPRVQGQPHRYTHYNNVRSSTVRCQENRYIG